MAAAKRKPAAKKPAAKAKSPAKKKTAVKPAARKPAAKKATPKKPAAKSPKKPARARVDLHLSSRRRRSLYAQAAKKSPAKPAAKPAAKKCGAASNATRPSLTGHAQVAREEGCVAEEAGRQEESREAGLEGEEPRQKEDGRQEVSGEEAGREEVPGEAIHAQQEEVVVPVSRLSRTLPSDEYHNHEVLVALSSHVLYTGEGAGEGCRVPPVLGLGR